MKEQKKDLEVHHEENLELDKKRQQLDGVVQRHQQSSISLDQRASMSDMKTDEALATAAKLKAEKEVAAKVGSISDDDSSDDDSDEDEVEQHYDSVLSFSSDEELAMVSDSDEEEAKTVVGKKEENSDDDSFSDDSSDEEEVHQNHRMIQALEEEITEVEESLDRLREQDEADLGKCRQVEEQEKKLLERAEAEGQDLRLHQANLGAQLQKRRTENDTQLNRMMSQDQELATIIFELERHSKARAALELKVIISIEPNITPHDLSQKLGA